MTHNNYKFIHLIVSDMLEVTGHCIFNEYVFNKCFREIDQDGSGTISKDEMLQFIKLVSAPDNLPSLEVTNVDSSMNAYKN